jgi:hypothetical protein
LFKEGKLASFASLTRKISKNSLFSSVFSMTQNFFVCVIVRHPASLEPTMKTLAGHALPQPGFFRIDPSRRRCPAHTASSVARREKCYTPRQQRQTDAAIQDTPLTTLLSGTFPGVSLF